MKIENRQTVKDLTQGSPEWKQHRSGKFNASDVPAMMGVDINGRSRNDLLRAHKTGDFKEANEHEERRFADGHRKEKAARAVIEAKYDVDLYTPTVSADVDGMPFSASLDGEADAGWIWEHKGLNQNLQKVQTVDDLPDCYKLQMTQQMLLSGAGKCLFTASDGTENGMIELWYEYDPEMAEQLVAHWKQFAEDLKTFEPREIQEKPEGKKLDALPTLFVDIEGEVKGSNLAAAKDVILAAIEGVNTDLQTDQDFSDAEEAVKFFKKAEEDLKHVKKQALARTASIEDLFNTIDELAEASRTKRLALDRLVTERKKSIRIEIANQARDSLNEHLEKLNEECDGLLPYPHTDFAGSMKGKRNIESLHNAADDEAARAKVEANQMAERVKANLILLKQGKAAEYPVLFNVDIAQLVLKEATDLEAVIAQRIQQHEASIAEQRQKEEAEAARKQEQAPFKQTAEKVAEDAARTGTGVMKAGPDLIEAVDPEQFFPSDFDEWWSREGKDIERQEDDDEYSYRRRVAQCAWSAANYRASKAA